MSALAWACSVLAASSVFGFGWYLRKQHREVARLTASAQRARNALFGTLLDEGGAALVFYADAGRIVYANQPARHLFFADSSPDGQNFLQLVASGPAPFRLALLGAEDDIASFDVDGQRETFHFARRTFEYSGEPHTLLIVRQLTREVARHEIEVLKRVVRLMSHEVNNALGPVSSLVHSAGQILRSGERPERLHRVFETIDERAKHLAKFVAGYATLSKLPRPEPREQPWQPLLTRLTLLYPEARVSSVEQPSGYFDAVQLEQALVNLLKNANEAGGPLSAVSLTVRELPGGTSLLQVGDGGRGFSAQALESGLLPFFTDKPGGSGIGLTLVREIVDAHDGQLTLGRGAEGGALVTVRLPGRVQPLEARARARLTLTRG
jgi:two-component system, NtrC family, nitrogen regulation sensor histidine kinase NtrY